jgi:hypothetical protein
MAGAERRTTTFTWVGLALMGVQFGALARLTWWEYSWDIMEPITYFVTYGTSIACFAYYVLTKQVREYFPKNRSTFKFFEKMMMIYFCSDHWWTDRNTFCRTFVIASICYNSTKEPKRWA